jgi:hypothetical protein
MRRGSVKVKWVPAILRRAALCARPEGRPFGPCLSPPLAAPPGIAGTDFYRTPEDGFLQPFRSAWRLADRSAWLAFCVAVWFALSAPNLFAGQPASAPPASATVAAAVAAYPPRSQTQGQAETAVLDWVLANSGPLKGDTRAGGFRVAFTITPAEGWWDKAGGGKLAWHEAPANNVLLRIFVLDLADGRLVPGLSLRAALVDANGNEQSAPADFGWYPLINAYGGNFPLAADSSYTLRVAIDPPAPRSPGARSGQPVIADFPPVAIAQNVVLLLPLATVAAEAGEVELLKPCNAALSAAITALWRQSALGAEKSAGDYFVAYALDEAALENPLDRLRRKNLLGFSGKDNLRLEILVRDSRTGRLLPGLKPQASLIAADGSVYGHGELPLSWHPWLTHYGRNLRIPSKGLYTLHVSFDAPGFRRWGRQGERFASPAEVEFDGLSLKPEASKPEGNSNP